MLLRMPSLPVSKCVLANYIVLLVGVASDTHFINPPDVGASDCYEIDVLFHLNNDEKL